MRAHLRTYFAGFYYSNSFSLGTRPHKSQSTTSAENGPAMAVPAGPVPAPISLLNRFAPPRGWAFLGGSDVRAKSPICTIGSRDTAAYS